MLKVTATESKTEFGYLLGFYYIRKLVLFFRCNKVFYWWKRWW